MNFVIYSLATWRLARLLVKEEGPLQIMSKLREATGIVHDASGEATAWPDWNPLHCVCCTSVWTAIVLLMLNRNISVALAASAVAVLAEDLETKILA